MTDKKIPLSIGAGVFFSGTALYLAFRNIPAGDLFKYLGSVHYAWLVPAVFISVFSFILRVFRWQWILKTHKEISFIRIYHPLMIGFMLNCIFPGRVGELARPLILMKKEAVPFSTGMGSIVTERLFDMFCLIVLFTSVLRFINPERASGVTGGAYSINSETLARLSSGVVYLFLVAVFGVIVLTIRKCRESFASLLRRIPGMMFFLSARQRKNVEDLILKPLIGLLEHFANGLGLFHDPVKILACLALSMTIWIIQGLSYHVMTLACPGFSISFTETMAVMSIICFFIALPSVPGYWGLWEAGGIFALSLFSVAGEQAAGYTLINHVIQIVPVILAGMASALILGVNIKQLHRQTEGQSAA